VRAFLGSHDFVFTGSLRWNALDLGATCVQAVTLVYNKKRSGEFRFGNRRFQFRRVAYPSTTPPLEWFAIDLLRHHAEAGVSHDEVLGRLVAAVRVGRFDAALIMDMAEHFARAGTVIALSAALAGEERAA